MNGPKKLHNEFVRLGGLRHKLKNKMLAILPEIYASGIWKKYASSIVEYAGKYGDIAKTTVIKRLRLEENLEGLPFLKAAIEKVGVHRVAMIAKIATPENDEKLAESILNMSKMAVQSLSKEVRAGQEEDYTKGGQKFCFDGGDNVQDQSLSDGQASACKAISIVKKIELDEESTFLFLKLKAKLGKNFSDKEFLKLILEEREKWEFPQRENKITKEAALPTVAEQSGATVVDKPKSITDDGVHACQNSITGNLKNITGDSREAQQSDHVCSRHIPAKRKRTAIAQTNGKCAYPNCNKPYEVIHHTNRYSESKNHNSIIPLCKIHHEFAHNNFIQNETSAPEEWQISGINTIAKVSQADLLYRKYKQAS